MQAHWLWGTWWQQSFIKNVGSGKRRRTNSVNTFLQLVSTDLCHHQVVPIPSIFWVSMSSACRQLVFGEKNSFWKKKTKKICSISSSCGPKYHKGRDIKGQWRSNAHKNSCHITTCGLDKWFCDCEVCCCVFLPFPHNFESKLLHLLNSTWAQIGRQRLNAFRHANVVKMTCQSSNWATRMGKKGDSSDFECGTVCWGRIARFRYFKSCWSTGIWSTTSKDERERSGGGQKKKITWKIGMEEYLGLHVCISECTTHLK